MSNILNWLDKPRQRRERIYRQKNASRAIKNGYAFDELLDKEGNYLSQAREKKNKYDFGMSYSSNYLYGNNKNENPTVVTSNYARNNVKNISSKLSSYNNKKTNQINNNNLDLSRFKVRDSGDDNDGESEIKRMFKRISNIRSGNFQYSTQEQDQINKINELGNSLSLRQNRANENYTSGVTGGEFRSGRMRYAQELADDTIYNSVQTGIEALDDLDRKTQSSVQQLESAIREDRVNDILKEYNMIQSYDKQRDKTYQNLIDSLTEYEQLQFDIDKESKAEYYDDYTLAQKQGYSGDYTDFLSYLEEIKLKGKYAPNRSNDYNSIPLRTGFGNNEVGSTINNGLVW